ncbi:MAG: amino acid ABC transporter permease [Oscillospiraceae bacterium]|jgi:polar amino acid transport system permease protein|nr:amino acid ABC transporter permease [Oscillospiraceae bacterium]
MADINDRQKLTASDRKKRGRIIALAVCVVLLVLIAAMWTTAPSKATLAARISESFKEEAGDKYRETFTSIGVVTVIRANSKTNSFGAGQIEMYLGAFGHIWDASSGAAKFVADISRWLPTLISGAGVTISLTITSVFVGAILAIFLALGKMSKIWPIRKFCQGYIFFFRGTPLLMQLFFVYYGLPLLSQSLAIQSRFLAAFIAFALNTGAYVAEIIRAALQSIDKGQYEAARSLGMSYPQSMLHVIIPQSVRRLIPPVANEFIMVLKDASLVSLIALTDLTQATKNVMNSSLSPLVFIPAMVLYLIITAVFTKIFAVLEQRYSVYQ